MSPDRSRESTSGDESGPIGFLALLLLAELVIGILVLIAVWPEVTKVAVIAAQNTAAPTDAAEAEAEGPEAAAPEAASSAESQPQAPDVPAPTDVPDAATPAAVTAATPAAAIHILWYRWANPSEDTLYLVAVIVMGGIGSLIHALTSLTTYAGNRTFKRSWAWWYVVRMPIGAAIATLLYFVVRGGLLSVTTPSGAISPYGVGALAGLSGMFSKQATDKLEEVFSTLFRTEGGDAERKDKVSEIPLGIERVEPPSLSVGTTDLTVTLTGTGFAPGMSVTVGGQARTVTVTSETECAVTLLAADVAQAGTLTIVVTAKAPSDQSSTAQLVIAT